MFGREFQTSQTIPALEALFADFKNDHRDLELDFAADLCPQCPPQHSSLGTLHGMWPHPVKPSFPFAGQNLQSRVPLHTDSSASSRSAEGLPQTFWGPHGQPDFPLLGRDFDDLPPLKLQYQSPPLPTLTAETLPTSRHSPPLPASLPMERVASPPDLKNAPSDETIEVLEDKPPSKSSLRHAAKMARERERAEKLKEKNKRAQRKFRQRQKDKQETAEKMASDLASQLNVLRLDKEALEARNSHLEWTLKITAMTHHPAAEPHMGMEPTFAPASGWTSLHPQMGMVLVATHPIKLTHAQMMSLSLRDVGKLLSENVRRLTEVLNELGPDSRNETVGRRLSGLLWERHAILYYLALNKNRSLYQILCAKMTDPPVENCEMPGLDFWENCVADFDFTESQLQTLTKVRTDFLGQLDKLLQERNELRKSLNGLSLFVEPENVPLVPDHHRQWGHVIEHLTENHRRIQKTFGYFMAQLGMGESLTRVQMARLTVRSWPHPPNMFAISKVLAMRNGEPDHVAVMMAERLKIHDSPSAVAMYLAALPKDSVCNDLSSNQELSEALRPLYNQSDSKPQLKG